MPKLTNRVVAPGANGAVETTEKVKRITLLEVKKRTIELKVRSLSPLIAHAWSAKAIRRMEDARRKKAKGGRPLKDPEEEFQRWWLESMGQEK